MSQLLPHGSLRWAALTLAACSLVADAGSAGSAELLGHVRRAGTGQPLAGVTLRLVHDGTGETRVRVTGASGEYGFRVVPAGTYTVTAEGPGLGRRVVTGVGLRVGTAGELDLLLGPAAEGRVEVVAEAALADPLGTQLATVLDPERIADLPINRRNFVELSLTAPGVTRANTPMTGGAPDSGLSFHGMRPRQNSFLVDGLDHNDLGNGAIRSFLCQEAVQEFQVVTAGFSAEFGRASGGLVNTVSKSGSNTFAGSVFSSVRPGAWAQASSANELRQVQYGASAGGALVPDRMFYFVAVERLELDGHNTVSIDPQVLAALRGAGFAAEGGALPYAETGTSVFAKLDLVQASSRWSLRLLQSHTVNGNQVPWGGLVARSAGGEGVDRDSTVSLSHQWQGAATWSNDIRLMQSTRHSELNPLDPSGGVEVDLLGMAQAGSQRLAAQDSRTVYRQLADTLSLVLAGHSLKLGADLLSTGNHSAVRQNFAGIYRFQAIPELGLGSALAAFLAPNPFGGTGLPVAFVQSFGQPETRFNTTAGALFLQDDWTLGPGLVLKLGLRYDRETLPTFDAAAAYRVLADPSGSPDPALGPVRIGDGPYPFSSLLSPSRDWSSSRVSPRLAFSWRLQDHLRLHGGWGIFTGSTNLGPFMGARLFNGSEVQTRFRTILDPVMTGPWITWANADGQAQGHRYASAAAGTATLVLPGSARMPETRQALAGLEWTPAGGHTLSLEWLASHGCNLLNTRDVNAYLPWANPATGQVVLRRPDLRFGSIQRVDGSGETWYHGVSLRWQWRLGERLALDASFTHSKAEDNYIDWNPDYTPQNSFDPGAERGPSDQDQRNRLLVSAVYRSGSELGPWLRGWTVAAIARAESGRPYSVLLGYDRNLNGDGTSDRPEGLGRNSARTPALRNVDLRLARSVTTGAGQVEFRVELFNLFNTTQVLQVQNNLGTTLPPFGSALRFAPKRQLQFGIRTVF